MNQDAFIAMVVFAFVSSITPGPNTVMLMASGTNFGVRRTIPHMLGVAVGFLILVVMAGVGLVGLFDLWPPAYQLLTLVSMVYMLWLAWKIANASLPEDRKAEGKPFTFLQAALFQWVNPKAVTMALTANAIYAPGHDFPAVARVAIVFGLVNLPSIAIWAWAGQSLRHFLSAPANLRAFNWAMAIALVASLALILL